MTRLLFLGSCLFQFYMLAQADGFYSIIAPGTLHPNSEYNVVVSVYQVEEPCKMELTVKGTGVIVEKAVEVQPNSSEHVQFDIPDIKYEVYGLYVKGVSGLIFKNETILNFAEIKPEVYLQTDKATYKPGDLIQFRAIFLDENTRPAKIEKPVQISIKDPASNRVKQYSNITLTRGVFSGKLQLSEFPLLGDWAIEVHIDGERYTFKTVNVDKYVLPKFEVTIDAPKKVCKSQEKLGFTVRSRYTFGKWVKGKAFVTIKSLKSNPRIHPAPGMPVPRGQEPINLPPHLEDYHDFRKDQPAVVFPTPLRPHVPVPLPISPPYIDNVPFRPIDGSVPIASVLPHFNNAAGQAAGAVPIQGGSTVPTPISSPPPHIDRVPVRSIDGSVTPLLSNDPGQPARVVQGAFGWTVPIAPPQNQPASGGPVPTGRPQFNNVWNTGPGPVRVPPHLDHIPAPPARPVHVHVPGSPPPPYLNHFPFRPFQPPGPYRPRPITSWEVEPRVVPFTIEKTVEFTGKTFVEFDMDEVAPRGLLNDDSKIDLVVVVEEALTANKQNVTTSIQIVKYAYNIHLPKDEIHCAHPEDTFNYTVAVTNLDDEPIEDDKNAVVIQPYTGFGVGVMNGNSNAFNRVESFLSKSGVAIFKLKCSESLNKPFIASYRGKTEYGVLRGRTDEETPGVVDKLTVKILTKNPTFDKDIKIEVSSNELITSFVYAVVGRGNILTSGLVTLPGEGRNYHKFHIEPQLEMLPQSTIYVHYVHGQDLRFAETSFALPEKFMNWISIDAPVQAKPGQEIQMQVQTTRESFVGLLGVDQSVLLLKSGNDFKAEEIIANLEKVSSTTPQRYLDSQDTYPGSKSGVVTLTNANFSHREKFQILYMRQHSLGPVPYGPGGSRVNFLASSTSFSTKSAPGYTSIPYTPPHAEPPRVRKEFLETWMYDDFESSANGLTVIKQVPDTITSWVITAFSLNPHTGFGLTETPTKIQTFRPFFISTNLPYAVKRGEAVTVPVILFNYMDQRLDAEVTFENSDNEFEFIDDANHQKKLVMHVAVESNNGETINFKIRPKHIGHITLKITAISVLAGDAIQKELKVEPEGVTIYKNRDFYVYGTGEQGFSQALHLNIPENVVPDSEYIEVAVMGDILGSTINNLDGLVRMPSGCGEQNMVNFVPNILVLRYLESIHQSSPAIEQKAKEYLEIGYQRELSYKHDNGSYSAFGKSDAHGSTWLTAYVVRSFHQAATDIDIQDKILLAGLDFLASVQADNGSFPEYGKVLDFSHQNDVGLTSFVLLAFLENNQYLEKYALVVNRGFQYLEQNVESTDDLYALSLAVYALQQRKLPIVDGLLKKLNAQARIDGGHKWWTKSVAELRPDQAWRPKSHDVEVTAYILMTLLDTNDGILPITKWLISQRNSNGGFASTQETVVGLQALIKFAQKSGVGNPDLKINVLSEETLLGNFEVNQDNRLVLQSLVLDKHIRNIIFNGTGVGSGIVQVSHRYNIIKKEEKPSFKLNTLLKPGETNMKLEMDVCIEYVPLTEESSKESNMLVMEARLPSGYTVDTDGLEKIKSAAGVMRVETKRGSTEVIVYYDGLKVDQTICTSIQADLSHEVADQKPVPIVVYDYYDNQRRATDFYQVKRD